MECTLQVDVYSNWVSIPPVYRLYVDDEMLTERYFSIRAEDNFLRERLFCILDTGVHKLKLESFQVESFFQLDNFRVNQKPVAKNFYKTQGFSAEWVFIVDNLIPNNKDNRIIINKGSISNPKQINQNAANFYGNRQKNDSNLALVQRMRELTNRSAKK